MAQGALSALGVWPHHISWVSAVSVLLDRPLQDVEP